MLAVALVLTGCSSTHGLESTVDADVTIDARSTPTSDAHTHDAFVRPDAWTLEDTGCVMPIGPEGLIPATTAECLGLADAACAGCHVRDEVWSLRPRGTPPPAGITPAPAGACGLCMP